MYFCRVNVDSWVVIQSLPGCEVSDTWRYRNLNLLLLLLLLLLPHHEHILEFLDALKESIPVQCKFWDNTPPPTPTHPPPTPPRRKKANKQASKTGVSVKWKRSVSASVLRCRWNVRSSATLQTPNAHYSTCTRAAKSGWGPFDRRNLAWSADYSY